MGVETPNIFPDESLIEPDKEAETESERVGSFRKTINKLFGRKAELELGNSENKQEASPKRFSLSVEMMPKLFREFKVEGKENIEAIPEGKRIILATTHTSDFDIPLVAAALSRDMKLVVTHISYQNELIKSLKASDVTLGSMLVAGRKNFLPIRYVRDKNQSHGRKGQINPEDVENIVSALDEGKAAIIAAHNPVFDDKLPDKPGFAAIRVAQLAGQDAAVVPVAVQIGNPSEEGRTKPGRVIINRPEAKVIIGKPLTFDDPDAKAAGDRIDSILRNKEEGSVLSQEENAQMKAAREVINETEGVKLMGALASLLPEEMRGNWKE
ncbi:MAG TPA: hypothetical protein VI432_00580 [Candidatus Paceibacterota bacterium]